MAEPKHPRVDPSEDWASRRKHAISRARELRSRIKEADCDQGSDLSSLASKSEIQRQRRSRQLEATQRLLDGQGGGFNLAESSSGRSIESKSRQKAISESRARHESSQQRYDHDEKPVGKGGNKSSSDINETHSIISQKHLGQIHRRYQKPTEDSSMTSKLGARSTSHSEEDDFTMAMKESKSIEGTSNFRATSSSDAIPEDTVQRTLREKPIGGRGRGRGRGRQRPSGSGGTSSLGELSRSSKSLSRAPAAVKDQMVDARSRSPSARRIDSSSSHPSQSRQQENAGDSVALPLQSYLKSRQVPDYKEGECEKLAILRQRLVARRQKRQHGLQNRKEKTMPEQTRRKTSSNESRHGNGLGTKVKTKSSSKEMSHSLEQEMRLERLDPNDYTAKDFQTKPQRRAKNGNCAAMASPARMQTHDPDDPDDRHAHNRESSMDKSQISSDQSDRGNDGADDEFLAIELIKCDCCKRSFAPKVYAKHFDSDGQPKCASILDKKRPVFNAAKVPYYVVNIYFHLPNIDLLLTLLSFSGSLFRQELQTIPI